MLCDFARLAVCVTGVLSLQLAGASAQCLGRDGDRVDLYFYGDDVSADSFLDPQASSSYNTSCESLDDAFAMAQNQTALSNFSGFFIGLPSIGENFVHTLSRGYAFSDLSLVAVSATEGDFGVLVRCDYQAGLAFENVDLVQIRLVNWTECGPITVNGTLLDGAMYLSDVSNLDIYKSQFHASYSSAITIQMNANKLYNYTISHCNFEANGKMVKQFNTNGGAISLCLEQHIQETISFVNTDFISNIAMEGGAVFIDRNEVEIGIPCRLGHIYFSSCNFIANQAEVDGGAAYLMKEDAVFQNCTFVSNKAESVGGAIYHYPYSLFDYCELERNMYDSCFWMDNKAKGAAAVFLGSAVKLRHIAVLFNKNDFTRNEVMQFSFFGESSCVLFVSDLNIQLEDVAFESNHGTAVCLDSAQVEMKGHVVFNLNEGYEGGAVYIYPSSYISPLPNTKIDFHHNLAIYGGAIYHREQRTKVSYCIFNLELSNSSDNVSVTFVNNTAFSSGNSIYLVAPTKACEDELNLSLITFIPDNVLKASSSALSINFKSPVYTGINDNLKLDVILGQQIVFNVTIFDYFDQPTSVLVNVFISRGDTRDHFLPPYHLTGTTTFTLKTGSNYPNIAIVGPNPATYNNNMEFVLQVIGADITKEIYLNFLPCPLGFNYSMTEELCQCLSLDNMICDLSNASVCISEGYWFGEVNNTGTTAICSTGFCHNVFGECSPCSINEYEEFCEVSQGMLADQCIGNRFGALCAQCDTNSSFTFGAVNCVLDTCSAFKTLLLVAINFFFMLIMIVTILIILKLGYNISSGYMFSIIYYFSIISHLLPLNFRQTQTVLILLSIFQAITQLSSKFIGYIPFCFSQNFKALELYSLFYLNPLMVGIFVFAFLILSKYCRRYVRYSDSTPIRAICLLMLCSFATLTETSFAIIMPKIFNNVGGVYVNIQPSTIYLDPKEHLPWFMIALVVMAVLIIPVTLLLLLAPCLARFTDLTRIKPFLDEFQSCYKDKYRWMASYYFLCRLLYLSILTSAATGLQSVQYTIQVISLGILVLHTLLQPYRKQVLNLVDTIILADITAITLLYGESASHLFQNNLQLQQDLTALLISIPILYLICGTFVAFARRYSLRKKIRRWLRRHSTQGNYFYKLSQHLSAPLLEDEKLTEPSDANDRARTVSTLSNSTRYREPYFRYLGYEDSDEEEDYDSQNNNKDGETEHPSGLSYQPTSSIVTLERRSSSKNCPGEVFTPSHTSRSPCKKSSNNNQHSYQGWLEQTTPAEDPEL